MNRLIHFISIAIITLVLTSCKSSQNNSISGINKEEIVIDCIHNQPSVVLPPGFKVFDEIQGDLNGDSVDDYVFIIKGTDINNVVTNRFGKEVDRNRRGLLIYLSVNNNWVLTTTNLSCFSSENEDGGVYYPPQLSVEIEKEKLYIDYEHGRYGYWKYAFRYDNSDFDLIGYDASSNYGPIVNREISINFLTKKKLTRENINQDTEGDVEEVFEETWSDVEIDQLQKLSEISDFQTLEME